MQKLIIIIIFVSTPCSQCTRVIQTHPWCFLLFCRAREALRQCLPDQLKDGTFSNCLKDDASTKRWLSQLMKNLQDPSLADPRGVPLPPLWLAFKWNYVYSYMFSRLNLWSRVDSLFFDTIINDVQFVQNEFWINKTLPGLFIIFLFVFAGSWNSVWIKLKMV